MTVSILPPSAYAVSKHSSLSDNYRFISTIEVIQAAETHGWEIVKAGEAILRKKSERYRGFQKHIIIMEHPNFRDNNKAIQFCIRNSHNGSSGLQLFVGCMVYVCANQLFSRDMMGKGNAISFRHTDKSYHSLQKFIAEFDISVNNFAKGIQRFEEKLLTSDQVKVFAKKAIELRFETDRFNEATIDESIECLHAEQREDNLWNVLNRVQESLVRGNVHVLGKNGKLRKTRKIKSMEVLVELNTKILNLAHEMVGV